MKALGDDRRRIKAQWLAAIYTAIDAGYDTATIGRAAGCTQQYVSQLKVKRERTQSS